MITPLDYLQASNNREHNAVRAYARMGCDVTLVARRMNRTPGVRALLRDCLSFKTRETNERSPVGSIRTLTIDPFMNYFAGVATAGESAPPADTGRRRSVRSRLALALRSIGALRDLAYSPCIWWVLRRKVRGPFDAAVGFGPWGAMGSRIARRLGLARRTIYIDRDYEAGLMPDAFRRGYTERLERIGVRDADEVISIGHRLADLRRAQTSQPVHVIPTGVDTERFELTRSIRSARPVGDTLVYAGNIISWAGLDLVIRALPALVAARPAVRVIVLGAGLPSYEVSLQQMATDLGVADRIEWRGRVPYDDLPRHLADADLGLAASQPNAYRQYAYPLKVIEYMAAGLPVVVTADTEAHAIVQTHETGIACAFCPAVFADQVAALLGDRERRIHMERNGPIATDTMQWHDLLRRELAIVLGDADRNRSTREVPR